MLPLLHVSALPQLLGASQLSVCLEGREDYFLYLGLYIVVITRIAVIY